MVSDRTLLGTQLSCCLLGATGGLWPKALFCPGTFTLDFCLSCVPDPPCPGSQKAICSYSLTPSPGPTLAWGEDMGGGAGLEANGAEVQWLERGNVGSHGQWGQGCRPKVRQGGSHTSYDLIQLNFSIITIYFNY